MKISIRLPVFIVVSSVLAAGAVGFISYWKAAEELNSLASKMMVAVRESRAASFRLYLSSIDEDLELLSESSAVKQALTEFSGAFSGFGVFRQRTEAILKLAYNARSPDGPLTTDNSVPEVLKRYRDVHAVYGPWLSHLAKVRGYYDVFLINASGDVVYSVAKEADFATNLLIGPWKDTHLGKSLNGALDDPPNIQKQFSDFHTYAPSGNAPASFFSRPIEVDGNVVGVLVFQTPISRINKIMQTTAGMGDTGQTYIVGRDRLMRSDSRFELGSTILKTQIPTEAVDLALAGRSGVLAIKDYRGNAALSAFAPFDFKAVRWAIISEMSINELLAPIVELRSFLLIAGAIVCVVIVLFGLALARSITSPLSAISGAFERFGETHKAEALSEINRADELGDMARNFDLVARQVEGFISQQEEQAVRLETLVQERTGDLWETQIKLERLVDVGILVTAEQDLQAVLETVLITAKEIALADGATIYLLEDEDRLEFAHMRNDTLGVVFVQAENPEEEYLFPPLPLYDPETGEPNQNNLATDVAHSRETVLIDDIYDFGDAFDGGPTDFDTNTGYQSRSFLTTPIKSPQGEVIGVLQLINAMDPDTGELGKFNREVVKFVEALASQAAVAIENQRLLEAQRVLMDAFIKLIAGAIDSKSQYTGGHCERVPELAQMLARAACDSKAEPFTEFSLSEEEWHEFWIASWLHDCGKVTTPEFVVDKATKLETIYNRIHEIRMRFEVLWLDAEIAALRAQLEGGDPKTLARDLDERRATLRDDFAFVAECNVGGEFMEPQRIERLEKIASVPWVRHFDDRLGLSFDEAERMSRRPETPLPSGERLLADKPSHVVAWQEGRTPIGSDTDYGFDVDVPENKYNLGEVYNLSVGRGTLTEEERYKINEHIMETIVMLEKLPFPKNMRRVPEFAGGHHEKMDGTGYPRRLRKEEMSIPARIMMVADIFEALTASDRPYKKAKTISESVRIMTFMRDDQHIDPDIFRIFLESGVYRNYAEKFLSVAQIDEVDVAASV